MYYISTITLPNNKPYYKIHHSREGYFTGTLNKAEANAKLDMLNSRVYTRVLIRSK